MTDRDAGKFARARAVWTLVDQVVSSGTNAVISFMVARRVPAGEFGAFAIAFTLFALTVGFSRAVGTSPMGMRYAGVPTRVLRSAGAAATGTDWAALAAALVAAGTGRDV